jgi:hypothetical protein
MIDPSDDPADPRYAPADLPRFHDVSPMVPYVAHGCCPHCGTRFSVGGNRARAGDGGMCTYCLSLVISDGDGGWTFAQYDQASGWDFDPRIIFMRGAWAKPVPA